MDPLESYLDSVRESLDLRTDAERDAIIAEIRDHILESAARFESEGLDLQAAVKRAVSRMGDGEVVAAAVSRSHEPSRALFPAKDIIPSSIFWGVWAAAAMAGANYIRLGFRSRGLRLIGYGLAAQLAVWSGLYLVEILIRSRDWWLCLSIGMSMAVNGAVGYWLYSTQREFYRLWRRRNPVAARKSPYLAWWVSVLAIMGAILAILVLGRLLYGPF